MKKYTHMHETHKTIAPTEANHLQHDDHQKTLRLHREALRYMLSLVQKCQERGGYTLTEAVELQEAVAVIQRVCCESTDTDADTMTTDDTDSSGAICNHVDCVARLLLKSQAQGRLSLQEAWTTYNALSVVCPSRVV